jgi:hypothetical protein
MARDAPLFSTTVGSGGYLRGFSLVARAAARSLLLRRCSRHPERKPPLGVAGYIEKPGGRLYGNFAARGFEGPRTSAPGITTAASAGR